MGALAAGVLSVAAFVFIGYLIFKGNLGEEGKKMGAALTGQYLGGAANLATIGVTGQVKLGIKFDAAPIRLAFDFSPVIGPAILYWKGDAACGFNTMGLCNLGISATYCF